MKRKILSFFLPLKKIPTATHQQKKVNFKNKSFYEPAELKNARALFTGLLAEHVPNEPLEGPLQLIVKWLYPMTQKSVSGQYKTSRPDVDNMQKLLMDCMTKVGYWKDDAQVSSMIVEKFYSEVVGIYINVKQL